MSNSSTVYGEGPVVSSTSHAAPSFIPMTDWVPAAGVLRVRATLEMRGNTGVCEINAAYQTSDDRVNPSSAVSIVSGGNYLTQDGFQYPSAFVDVSSDTKGKQYVRFGVMCRPGSGISRVEGCWAALRVDVQEQFENLVAPTTGRITSAGAVTNYIGCETANNVGSGIIGAGCTFAKDFPSTPSSFTAVNQSNSGVNNTINTWNATVYGVGIYHTVTGSGNAYFYEGITAS